MKTKFFLQCLLGGFLVVAGAAWGNIFSGTLAGISLAAGATANEVIATSSPHTVIAGDCGSIYTNGVIAGTTVFNLPLASTVTLGCKFGPFLRNGGSGRNIDINPDDADRICSYTDADGEALEGDDGMVRQSITLYNATANDGTDCEWIAYPEGGFTQETP